MCILRLRRLRTVKLSCSTMSSAVHVAQVMGAVEGGGGALRLSDQPSQLCVNNCSRVDWGLRHGGIAEGEGRYLDHVAALVHELSEVAD